MNTALRWMAGLVAAAIVLPGTLVLAAEGEHPAAAPAPGKSEYADLMKQIKAKEAPVLEKNAELKAAVEAIEKQIAEKRGDRSKAPDAAAIKEMQDLRKQRQENMLAAEPGLADLYKKLDELRAAGHRRMGGGEHKPAEGAAK